MTIIMTVYFLVTLLALVIHAQAGKRSNLLGLIQVYRHGERAPAQFYPNDPYQDFSYWNTNPGQLTNTGKQQQFELGQYTRRRYSRFIPRLYSEENFLVRSTNMDRTFMSAAANVAGLYPPVGYQVWRPGLNWQPIPVFPVDVAVLSSYFTCNAYVNAITELFSTDEYFLNALEEYREVFEYVSEHSGTNATGWFNILTIWDALNIENIRNYTLPEWAESIFPEPITSLATYYYLSNSYTEELKILTTGPFFHTVIEHFEAILAGSSSAQPHLQFSGHDSNLASVLGTLGAFSPPLPGFASAIYFELRGTNSQNYINIYYSNSAGVEPAPVTLAGCDFDCSLQDFKNILGNRTITPDEWQALCNV